MNASAYLERFAAPRPAAADEASLAALHRAHLYAVPFENLDIHLGRALRLEPEALYRKIVEERRGGFCYELNGLFAWLLGQLGYRVTLLSARVSRQDGTAGPEFDHLALRVDLERPLLADVGFGDGFLEPLPLAPGTYGAFRLSVEGDVWHYERRDASDRWSREYQFTLAPRRMEDFLPMCRWHETAPESHFVQRRLCTRATPDGRITFSERRLIETRGGERTTTLVEGPDAEATLLRERFGVRLPPRGAA